ncbi:MAG: porin Omp33-36 [Acinetobacter sp.]|jgi:hypothetical protein
MKKLGLATALLLAMTGANAYQFEVQGQAETIDAVAANDKDFSAGGQATYYFKNVDASKGPLAEAAFINQASNVAVAYNYGQFDEFESQNYGIKGEAYFPTSIVPAAYASLSYNAAFNDGKYGFNDDHGDRWALEVGSVVAPNFLVTVGYTNIAAESVLDTFKIVNSGIFKAAGETATIGEDQDAITARTKYVGAIDGTPMSIGFETGIVYGDATAFELKTDLYLNSKISGGVSYVESSIEGTPDSAWGVNANYFVTPAIALGASYVNANVVGADADVQTVGLNAKLRF